jgi:hypothetical protein
MRLAGSVMFALAFVAACGQSEPAPATGVNGLKTPDTVQPATAAPASTDANDMTPADISAKLVGTFVSANDDKSKITVTSDGDWIEAYEGSGETTAEWRVFAGTDAPKDTGETFTPASRYLELLSDSGTFYYELGGIDEDGFDMFYVLRGNHLSFVRLKVPA